MNVKVGLTLLVAATLPLASPAMAAKTAESTIDQTLEAVRSADMRLAMIGYRLAVANAPLCDVLQPGTGLQFHALTQYAAGVRPDARRHYGFSGPIAVEGVVAASPASTVGVRDGDTVIAINDRALDQSLPGDTAPASIEPLTALDRQIATFKPAAPIRLSLRRNGVPIDLDLKPIASCRTRFELLLSDRYEAQADGELVQIGSKFLDSYSDEEVAVIVAHELAHNILRHRERLEAAKVSFGLLAEIGKNGRLFRQTETEADQLGVVLLANAGYDPMSAARFWRGPGAKIDGGLFRSRTHSGAASRAKITDEVAAAITPGAPRPIISPLIATRDQPLR